jgi:hypothetical protein
MSRSWVEVVTSRSVSAAGRSPPQLMALMEETTASMALTYPRID